MEIPWRQTTLKSEANEKHQINPAVPSNRHEAPGPTNHHRKVQVGNDQEMVQKERNSHSTN